jgi:hypothetical protein
LHYASRYSAGAQRHVQRVEGHLQRAEVLHAGRDQRGSAVHARGPGKSQRRRQLHHCGQHQSTINAYELSYLKFYAAIAERGGRRANFGRDSVRQQRLLQRRRRQSDQAG